MVRQAGKVEKIQEGHLLFWQDKDFTSNFFWKPFTDESGEVWQCSEQLFMWYKAMFFGDHVTAAKIKALLPNTPEWKKEASRLRLDARSSPALLYKRLGREVHPYNEAAWAEVSYDIMVQAVKQKFSDPELGARLLKSEDLVLVEASPLDRKWGIGYDAETAMANKDKWGENLLGKALMEVRQYLRAKAT